jgi:hypothetical protein
MEEISSELVLSKWILAFMVYSELSCVSKSTETNGDERVPKTLSSQDLDCIFDFGSSPQAA